MIIMKPTCLKINKNGGVAFFIFSSIPGVSFSWALVNSDKDISLKVKDAKKYCLENGMANIRNISYWCTVPVIDFRYCYTNFKFESENSQTCHLNLLRVANFWLWFQFSSFPPNINHILNAYQDRRTEVHYDYYQVSPWDGIYLFKWKEVHSYWMRS